MNKEKFMLDLEKKLKKIPKEEKENALDYYQEYFDEAGEENEEKILKELGSPSKIASEIMANFIVKEATTRKEEDLKHSISTVWLVVLTILASPIALPIALTIIALIFVAWITIISFWMTGLALLIIGVTYSILSIFVVFQDVSLASFILGCGLLGLGMRSCNYNRI